MSIVLYLHATMQELRIIGIEIYKRDIRVIRAVKKPKKKSDKKIWFYDPEGNICVNEGINKHEITQFTKSSQRTLAFVAQNTEIEFERMITLTYPKEFSKDGREVKKHLAAFIQYLRRKKVKAYLWFLEFQGRGAPHFHILISGGNEIDRMDVSQRWYEIVGSFDINHLNAGTRIERGKSKRGLHKYCVKYATKARQKAVPPDYLGVGRLWGCSRNVTPKKPLFVAVDCESSLSAILQDWQYSGKEKEGYNILFDASDSVISLLLKAGYFDRSQSVGWGG